MTLRSFGVQHDGRFQILSGARSYCAVATVERSIVRVVQCLGEQMLRSTRLFILVALAALTATSASSSTNHYGLTISTAATYNVSFNNGVFTATGDRAVLNVTDLETALASGDTEGTTDSGSGGGGEGYLHVDAATR